MLSEDTDPVQGRASRITNSTGVNLDAHLLASFNARRRGLLPDSYRSKFVDVASSVYCALEVERDLMFKSRERLQDSLTFYHSGVSIMWVLIFSVVVGSRSAGRCYSRL